MKILKYIRRTSLAEKSIKKGNDMSTLDYETFKHIVGEELLEKFRNIKQIKWFNE